MENPKWWHVVVVAVAILLTAMLFFGSSLPVPQMFVALGLLAVFVLCWFTFGRLAFSSSRAAIAFITVMIVSAGVLCALHPSMATIQCVAYPLIWMTTRGLRNAIIANVLLALSVGVGISAGYGFAPDAMLQGAFVAALSLAFSIALGLWISRIFDLSAEKQRLIDELRAAEGQVAALHRDAGVASERERLSRELHDTIAQSLTGLVMLVQGARRDLDAGKSDPARAAMALVEDSARNALSETRALVASGASVEVPGGIVPALHRLAERFERETGVTVTVAAKPLPSLDRGNEVVLLRCAQEALANVRKHARASTVAFATEASDAGIELRVTDDGIGFTPGETRGGFGLAGMRERLALAGGSLEVDSGSGGTVLTARVPAGVVA